MIILTSSAKHLEPELKKLRIQIGKTETKKHPDGENYVRILEDVSGKEVFLVAGLQPPADNIIETLLFLDALERNKAKINLVVLYFGYARQDRIVRQGEALSSEVLAKSLGIFKINRMHIIDIHSDRDKEIIERVFGRIVDYHFPFELLAQQFAEIKNKNLAVVSPDFGGVKKAEIFANILKIKNLVVIKKERAESGLKISIMQDNVRGKNLIIVDDIIASGGTLMEAAKLLKKSGAKDIYVAATHGIFCRGAIENIEKSSIKKIFVTNTIPQGKSRKMEVVSVADVIKEIVGIWKLYSRTK
ncbi:MAG TPA: ribose-phosphate diphosphokinase [Candidatus Nanoarchaeia archaeon]|nr:ribose-phosphate diphosphokinase [Candidatus Nanoarchaeia archaeon]